jgi:hypothetical protein
MVVLVMHILGSNVVIVCVDMMIAGVCSVHNRRVGMICYSDGDIGLANCL